jgi:hypothetical protein
LIRATNERGQCRVRSRTGNPCPRAAVKIWNVPFCEPCAREQEAYFAIGELTGSPGRLDDESLVGMLGRLERCVVEGHEPVSA